MVLLDATVIEPIPISLVAGRYLIFDNNVVAYLRKTYNVCGVLIGSLPQIPQQNVFLGLPMELLPEEAKLLVQKGAGYIFDSAAWHKEKLSSLRGGERKIYLQYLQLEGQKARNAAEINTHEKTERHLVKQLQLKATAKNVLHDAANYVSATKKTEAKTRAQEKVMDSVLLNHQPPSPMPLSQIPPPSLYTTTPACTVPSLLPSQIILGQPEPSTSASYALFVHLHALNYFITPGLRFGCDYAVYPGDPLRFHSHFLAAGYEWDQPIPLLDLVGGGRLGTGVKKGFLIGAEDPSKDTEGGTAVRTFCIEWGGM